MEYLRFILILSIMLGLMATGSIFFQKYSKSSFFLGILILVLTLKQASFIYETSNVLELPPNLFMATFPLAFLLGPALYFHANTLNEGFHVRWATLLIHLVPFFVFVVITFFLPSMNGLVWNEFVKTNLTVPTNWIEVIHVLSYGLFIGYHFQEISLSWTQKRKNYLFSVLSIYIISSFLQICFYTSILPFEYFIVYHVATSTLILIVCYILRFHQKVLQKITSKYSSSTLSDKDMQRVEEKINQYLSNMDNLTNRALTLSLLSNQINERKHHISQTLSSKFAGSFNDVVNRRRVEYSKKLLIDTRYSKHKILAVAMDSGFTNKNTYHRAFLKYVKFTPTTFKKINCK